ncbi:MAG: ribonuclease H-like domain-containing protein [Clostridiales bacterium]|nr:ribonuclease H-like domain-containing protein [Clostridiales bacterium]
MKTWQNEIPFCRDNPITEALFPENAVFFDIETTGFSAKHTQVYLIGCAARKGNVICTTQFFAENSLDEKLILNAFSELLTHYDILITFNGVGFDIPYLQGRYHYHSLMEPFENFEYLDIYKSLSKYKHILKLENLKQKTIELFLGIQRKDLYSGGELINIYDSYVKEPSEDALNLLRLHNYEDVTGMIDLLPILSYVQLFDGNFKVTKYETCTYEEYEGGEALELHLDLKPVFPLPKRFSYGFQDIYLTGFQNNVKLKVKIYQGELKYFYSNYKDYYYLPKEDMAIHKSVAFYVDKNYRTKAKAATCYSKKTGCFLPQYEEIFVPYFKLEFHDKVLYFEMTEDFTDSVNAQKNYALHLLKHLLTTKA